MLGGNISILNLAIFKPQLEHMSPLVVLIANRLGINIKTDGTYGDTKLLGNELIKQADHPMALTSYALLTIKYNNFHVVRFNITYSKHLKQNSQNIIINIQCIVNSISTLSQ